MKYDTPEAALAALSAPSDLAAGFYMHNDTPIVVRVIERDGDLALVLDDGGEVPRVAYLGSMFTRQELTLVERWRTMPGERRVAFLALSQLLALTPDDGRTLPCIVEDAMREFAGARMNHSTSLRARLSATLRARSMARRGGLDSWVTPSIRLRKRAPNPR